MIAIVDVDYRDDHAVAACVLVNDWIDEKPLAEFVETISDVQPYVSGEFYRRELPCLLAVLSRISEPDFVVIDGYCWLGPDRFGLGAHLHEKLNQTSTIIGVAKTRFLSADEVATPVLRGKSKSPLWITAIGIEPNSAADSIRSMHGPQRIPTLIKRADQLCRQTK